MLEINTILQKRYRIIRPLGQGGMGAVYEAFDERIGERIALKEILFELANLANEEKRNSFINAFLREAQTLANAKHEGIPFVRDFFSELDRQFIVMELIEGSDLSELLKKNKKPLPLEEVSRWIEQLLDVLDYLHNLSPQIIHRDIKPQNLKLDGDRIKLLDFGIAKIKEIKTDVNLTQETFVGATSNYSPIEQLLQAIPQMSREFFLLKHKEIAENILQQKTDVRCDIYAVGATFYHLLTNCLPTESNVRILRICEGKDDPLPNPTDLNPAIPPAISKWLLKSMAIERKNRFSSAREMKKAFFMTSTEEMNVIREKSISVNSWALTQSLPTDLLNLDSLENESTFFDSKSFFSENSSEELYDTQPPKDDLETSGVSYLTLPKNEETTPESFESEQPEPGKSKNEDLKLFWLLPIFACTILAIGGIGSAILFFSDNGNEPKILSTNTENSTLSPAPSPTENPSGNPSATPTLDAETDDKPPKSTPPQKIENKILNKTKKRQTKVKKTKKTNSQRVKPTPKNTPKVKTSPTPEVVPVRKNINCIYNNTC